MLSKVFISFEMRQPPESGLDYEPHRKESPIPRRKFPPFGQILMETRHQGGTRRLPHAEHWTA